MQSFCSDKGLNNHQRCTVITVNRWLEAKNVPQLSLLCDLNVWFSEARISVSHLVWTGVVVRPTSYDKELCGAAGNGGRADGFFHWRHLCPTIGEGVVTLHTAEAALSVIATYSVDLKAQMHTHIFHILCKQILIFLCTSWRVWTIVSTSALREPVFQVQKMMYYLWTNPIISLLVCLHDVLPSILRISRFCNLELQHFFNGNSCAVTEACE